MIFCLRLLFGATSFISWRRLAHFSASGPSGTRESNVVISTSNYVQIDRNPEEPYREHDRYRQAQRVDALGPLRLHRAQRLERTPEAVTQVEAQEKHRDDVERHPERVLKRSNHQTVEVGVLLAID